VEFHDSCEPSTTSCPLLPGQRVNILDVPYESRSRSSSISSISSDIHTLNPADKYVNPKPPTLPATCFEIDCHSERVVQELEDCVETSLERAETDLTFGSKFQNWMPRSLFRTTRPMTSSSLPLSVTSSTTHTFQRCLRRRAFSEGERISVPDSYGRTGICEAEIFGEDSGLGWEGETDDGDSAIFVKPGNLHITSDGSGFISAFRGKDDAQIDGLTFYDEDSLGSFPDSRPISRGGEQEDAYEAPFGLNNALLELDPVGTDHSYASFPCIFSSSEATPLAKDAESSSQFPSWRDPTDFQYLVSEEGPIQSPSFSLHTASSCGILTPNRNPEHQEKEYFPPGADYFGENFGSSRRASNASDTIHMRPNDQDHDSEFCAALGISELLGNGASDNTSLNVDFDELFSHRNIFSHKDASQGTITPLDKIAAAEQHGSLEHAAPPRSVEPQNPLGQIDTLIDDFAYLGGAVS
jgi:hypothetical protein